MDARFLRGTRSRFSPLAHIVSSCFAGIRCAMQAHGYEAEAFRLLDHTESALLNRLSIRHPGCWPIPDNLSGMGQVIPFRGVKCHD